MPSDIRLFPCLSDNFGTLIHDPATGATASIDAPEAKPIVTALEKEGWRLTDTLEAPGRTHFEYAQREPLDDLPLLVR